MYLMGRINALYYKAAAKMGVSDSVQNTLCVLCEKEGRCICGFYLQCCLRCLQH